MEENIHLKDESNDRGYFTIIPNYILNHSTAVDQALYIQMKRLAGEKGECFASRKYFCKQLRITERTFYKSLKYLIEHEWIKFVGKKKAQTKGGRQGLNCYVMLDLWHKNKEFYKGGENDTYLDGKEAKGGENDTPKGGENDTPKKNSIKEDLLNTLMGEEEFNSFWEKYPKRIAKSAAQKVFLKIEKSKLPLILKAIESQRKTEQWLKDAGQFIPYPATWLNGQRWNDEIKTNSSEQSPAYKLWQPK